MKEIELTIRLCNYCRFEQNMVISKLLFSSIAYFIHYLCEYKQHHTNNHKMNVSVNNSVSFHSTPAIILIWLYFTNGHLSAKIQCSLTLKSIEISQIFKSCLIWRIYCIEIILPEMQLLQHWFFRHLEMLKQQFLGTKV